MKHFARGDIAVAFVCILLGFVVAVQLRSVNKNIVIGSAQSSRAEELQIKVNDLTAENASLLQQLLEYKDSLDKYRSEASTSSDYAKILSDDLAKAEILAGLVDVEGPGIIGTMKDSAAPEAAADPNNDIIHDDDILRVINELRDAGAEVISINDERILSTSEIRCSGSTGSVNTRRYAAPYVIKAIGDAKNMEAALTMRHGVVEILENWNIEVNIVKSNKIRIVAYKGSVTYQHAIPVAQ
jgi:uncharacterized protein YlxW (UPF0749 family)